MTNTSSQIKKVKQKSPEEIIQEINRRCVRIKKKERINNNIVLYTVLGELLKLMRECDKLFDSMNPKLQYLGSYFDGLRVGQPTEYDLNVILTIHVNYNKIKLASEKNAYVSIKMPEEFRRLSSMPATAMKGFENTKYWCDKSYRLLVSCFRSWMQSVVDSAITKLPEKDGKRILPVKDKYFEINFKMSGPASTITIHLNGDYVIDVDLVPTLQFDLPKVPEYSKIDFNKVTSTKVSQYFAVPKPNEDDFSWRLAFPYQERFYTANNNNLKSTLKLLKLFRDIQGFDKLASYFIKTLFLWEIIANEKDFWKDKSLVFLVIYMLGKLRECLAIGIIKNFWCPEHNLLEKIKLDTCRNWANRITNVLKDIERNKKRNPEVFFKYFTKLSPD